jgi:hypothetical protein
MSGSAEPESHGGALQAAGRSALVTRGGFGRVSQGYLLDPNYYRLGYQLAAQRLNSAIQRRTQTRIPILSDERGDGVQASAIEPELAQSRAAEREIARYVRRELKLAREDGLALNARASEAIKSIENLRGPLSWVGLHPRPNAQQRRLRRFLVETVIPCSELVVAGAFAVSGRRGQAERHAAPVREMVKSSQTSYRAAYNLACYELTAFNGQPSLESTAWALEALRIALKAASNSRQRSALIAWARDDPALAPMRPWKAFERLLTNYEIDTPKSGATG